MLRYALLGRTCSGRRFFQQLLEKNSFTVAKSYTTRERRDENDNQHHFIENIHDYDDERVLETYHNGYTYFYTMRELENAEIIPIDPENIKTLCEMFPDDIFRFIEIVANNEDRLTHAVANAEDKLTAEEDFLAECEAENEAFCKIEDAIGERHFGFDNLLMGHVINNDFTENADIFDWVDKLKSSQRECRRMGIIIEELAANNIIGKDPETGKFDLAVHGREDNPFSVNWLKLSRDIFVENVLSDAEGVRAIMESWLRLENIHFKDE